MSISRRSFIKFGSLTALTAIALPTQIFGQTQNAFKLSSNDFRNQIGSHFLLINESSVTEAILTEVRSSPNENRGVRNTGESFSLAFLISDGEARPQATYDATHQTLGNFPVFLVPGRSAADEQLLIAVFNRL